MSDINNIPENNDQNNDSDEDDFTGYFMQPVCVYNIKEKVDEANKILFSEEVQSEKKCLVHFSIDLCEYEPDYSSNNEHSDSVSEEMFEHTEEKPSMVEENLSTEISLMTLEDEPLEESDKEEEISTSEDVLEETDYSATVKPPENSPITLEIPAEPKDIPKSIITLSTPKHELIDCEKYCIEFTEERSLNIGVNYHPAPLLKLHRPCCMKSDKKLLPFYNGYNSEYGLSKYQLDKKCKRTARKLQKAQEKLTKKALEKHEKIERNERTFCEWLKSKLKPKSCSQRVRAKVKSSRPLKCAYSEPGKFRCAKKTPANENNITCVISLPQNSQGGDLILKERFPGKNKHSHTRVFKVHFILKS